MEVRWGGTAGWLDPNSARGGGKRGTEVCSIELHVTGKRFTLRPLTAEGFDRLNQTVGLTVADRQAGPFALDIRRISLARKSQGGAPPGAPCKGLHKTPLGK